MLFQLAERGNILFPVHMKSEEKKLKIIFGSH